MALWFRFSCFLAIKKELSPSQSENAPKNLNQSNAMSTDEPLNKIYEGKKTKRKHGKTKAKQKHTCLPDF